MTAAGCADTGTEGSTQPSATVDSAATSSPAETAPTDPIGPASSPTGSPERPEVPEEGVVVADVAADDAQEQAVADVAIAYWEAIFAMYAEAKVDRAAFARVAQGRAFDMPVGYVGELQRDGLRQRGGAVMTVLDVTMGRSSAEVRSCFVNQALNFTADGRPAEQPLPFFVVRNVLVPQGGGWRVSRSITVSENEVCDR